MSTETNEAKVIGLDLGRVILGVVGFIVFVGLIVFAVVHFTKSPDLINKPQIATSLTDNSVMIAMKKELDELRAEKVAIETQRVEAEKESLFREELATVKRIAEEREKALREEMLAAIASAKAETPQVEAPLAGASAIEKLSPEKTAALLNIGTPGQGYIPPGHEGGPLVFSLSEITGTGGERIFLPNVNEGRSVSGAPGENIPAPQMKCAMPPGVAQLRWVQTSSPDPKKAGHFFYGLAPY
jgi:hypothetical protein